MNYTDVAYRLAVNGRVNKQRCTAVIAIRVCNDLWSTAGWSAKSGELGRRLFIFQCQTHQQKHGLRALPVSDGSS